jgi:hypothetical protein
MDRSPRRRLTLVAVAVTVAAVLAACGDDDDKTAGSAASTTVSTTATTGGASTPTSGSESTTASSGGEVGSKQDYIDAAESAIGFEDEDIRGCVAEAVVSDKVYASIQGAGLSVDDFKTGNDLSTLKVTEDEATSIADDMAACGELLPQLISGDEAQLNCAKQNLSNVQTAQLLSFQLFGINLPEDLKTADAGVRQCSQGSAPSSPSTT